MIHNDPSSADPFGLIADEFVEAFRQGKRPSVEEFARRYPEHASEIREMLPALAMMEKAKSADGGSNDQQVGLSSVTAPLQQLGDYQILREVGRGGMGVVYEAQQLSLGRHVAIKVLPGHALLDPRQLARFQREARSAAKLHHTNIVPVFGVGEQEGLHYYVMQFIHGLGLDLVLNELHRLRQPRGKQSPTRGDSPGSPTHVTRNISAVDVAQALVTGNFTVSGAPPKDEVGRMKDEAGNESPDSTFIPHPSSFSSSATIRLPGQTEGSTLSESGSRYWHSVARVGMQVADALAHAASQGILHRDIKPSNLLLDDTGNVWVTDFGLAKTDDGDNLTHTGDIVGTLRYMAPERFNGQGDLRSDVYSLGLTLYELLTLRPAFDVADRNKLVKEVVHGEPARPRKLNPGVPRDLETVVLKAIARDPSHRYQTPAEMAEDLKRFVEDRPVKARRISEWERLWRWCRRNPAVASLLSGIVLVFLVGFTGVFWQWRETEAARRDEESQRNLADWARKGAENARDEAKRREGDARTARDEAKQARNAAARQAAGLLLDRGIEDARGGEPGRALHLFVQALRALPPDDTKAAALERAIRANLSAWAETVPALEHLWHIGINFQDVVFSPDGELIALAVGKDEIQCFRTGNGQPSGPRVSVRVGQGAPMVFAPDGRSLWVASPGRHRVVEKGAIHRFDPVSGRPIQPPIPTTAPVVHLAVSPAGKHLVGAVAGLHPGDRGGERDADRTRKWRTASLVVWEAATGGVVRTVPVNAEHEYATANEWPDTYTSISPDGKTVTSWVERGANRFEGMSFTVDGKDPPTRVQLPDLGPGAPQRLHFENHMRTAMAIKDGQLHRWSASAPGVLGPGVPTPFISMHYSTSADGRSVISVTQGRVFDTGAWPPRPTGVRFPHPGWQRSPGSWSEQSPDGRFTATWLWESDSDRRLWRLPRPRSRPAIPTAELARQPDRPDSRFDAAFDHRGASAILWWGPRVNRPQEAFETHTVEVVDVTTGAVRVTSVRHSALVRQTVFSPDGRHFATASFDSTARVFETATGRPAGPPLRHTNYVAAVTFSPDGNTLAAGDYGPRGLVKFWDWRTGKEVRPPLEHDDIVVSLSFSPDGHYLVAIKLGSWTNKPELLIWEVASGTAVVRMRHVGPPYYLKEPVRFRPDGRVITTRDVNGVLSLWEVPSGKLRGEPRPLDGHGVTRFSPDGRVIAAAANLGVRLLDGDTLAPLQAGYLPHPDPITDVAFSPDGAYLLTGHETGSAQLWDVATRKPIGPPAVLVGPIRAVTFTPDGKSCACVAADGTVRRWPVPTPFAEPDLARLGDRVALVTGQRMDDNQGLDSIPADKWRTLRTKLVGEGTTALVAPRPDVEWHDTAASDAEQDGDAFGAEWHLDRLAKLRPKDWTVPARRGRVLATAGRTDEAATAYDVARRLAPSPQALSDWLRARSADDEVAGRKEAATWNLDRAIALTPDDWTLYVLRADLADSTRAAADFDEAIRRGAEPGVIVRAAERSAQSGEWKRAADLFNKLARNPALSAQGRFVQAVANLKAGDSAGYRAACAGIVKRLAPVGPMLSPVEANSAALAFTLGQAATDNWAKPLAWTEHALALLDAADQENPNVSEQLRQVRHAFLYTRGAVLYRAGRFEQAAKVLRKGMRYDSGGGDVHDWLFLALAEHRLGHADAAKAAASKARSVKAKVEGVWDRAVAELLAAELDANMSSTGK
jgi:serine/threonine protein kinase/WD40 repeat protein/tetratricopeptide (TPR) repeat protein